MSQFQSPEKSCLDSALLFLSRKPKSLAALLSHYLPSSVLKKLARSAGRRRPGRIAPADQISDVIPHHLKLRGACIDELLPLLVDAAPVIPESHRLETEAASYSAAARSATLRLLLTADNPDSWEQAGDLIEHWEEFLQQNPCPEPPSAATDGKSTATAPTLARRLTTDKAQRMRQKEEKLLEQLLELRHEMASAEQRLNAEHQRKARLQGQLEEALTEADQERMRATDFKRQLLATTDSSEREEILRIEADECRRVAGILEQKLRMVSEERDDLRGVLEDYDRFAHAPEEEVPSFRDRPLTSSEQELVQTIAQQQGLSLRILVVGGGERQHKHQGKLTEYADVMGFHSHWRMAEYQSWHRELDTLARDMRERFDALIILHWNRTTFTRKAREICDQDGAKPCLTCYYEGFTNLRESLQECLKQLLAAHKRGS
ncbi:MAG: hypothetical protein HQ519_02715 [Planctomycetes bacterium]|nr:hypothetical protein [Planctomycetota bacterium]